MQKSIYLLAVSFLLLFTSSCRKDSFIDTIDKEKPEVEIVNFVEARVQGVVVDNENNALGDVSVRWGSKNVRTDENGVFILSSVVKERNARLEISKEGFFTSRQILQTFPGEKTQTKVQLIPREWSGRFSSQENGEIVTNGGGQIDFTAGGFVSEDGNPYVGDVNVYAYYLDPSREDLSELMTGNLLARNTTNEMQVLQSYGMMNVELEDEQGRKLQISKAARITSPIPDKLLNNAPESIPLWYYDLEDDLWKEEGKANLDGNSYVGEVNHFTWWNCDVPEYFIYLEGKINPIRGSYWDHHVRVTIISTGASAVASVTQEGRFAGFVPKGEMLLLEILNTCFDVIHSETIGGFEEDTVLPSITVNAPPDEWYLISGSLVDCDENPVSNGYVSINYANQSRIIFVDEGGMFAEVFPKCVDNQVIATGIDLENLLSSLSVYATLDEDLDLETLKACDELGGEFSISLNGESLMGQPCTMRIESISPTQERYDITLVHPQENGTVIYLLYIGNSDIADPTNWSSIGFQDNQRIVQGDPEFIFDIKIGAPITVEILENTRVPGDTFHFVSKVSAVNILTGQELDNADLEIMAIIQ